jgi:hypothetical protein
MDSSGGHARRSVALAQGFGFLVGGVGLLLVVFGRWPTWLIFALWSAVLFAVWAIAARPANQQRPAVVAAVLLAASAVLYFVKP